MAQDEGTTTTEPTTTIESTAKLVDGVLDVIDAGQPAIVDGQADYVEAKLSPMRPHL